MKYKIHDKQTGGYFAGGAEFDTLEDMRLQLISYHSVDWTGENDIDTMSLLDIVEYGEWSIEDTEGNIIEV